MYSIRFYLISHPIYLHIGLGTKNSVKKTNAHNNHILKVVKKNDSLAKMLPFFAADEKSKLLENWDKVYHHPYDWSDLDVCLCLYLLLSHSNFQPIQ